MTNLVWLQDWYASWCDGEWEHSYGIEIETVDNPGWGVRIHLNATGHAHASLLWRKIERSETNWVHWCVQNKKFIGYCGATNLNELIDIFRAFIESEESQLIREAGTTDAREGRPWRALTHDLRAHSVPGYEPDRLK